MQSKTFYSLNDEDCVEGITLRLDMLKRYLENIGVEERIIELVNRALCSLSRIRRPVTATGRNQCAKIYTGGRGKPAFEIKEEQLRFLLRYQLTVTRPRVYFLPQKIFIIIYLFHYSTFLRYHTILRNNF